jgi:magnesium-transporting ATPase (P-type)
VRALSQPVVLRNAALAALLTTIACLPQLISWEKRQLPVWYLGLVLLLATFVLWAFVFAWHRQYAGRNPFNFPRRPHFWLAAATGCGILGAIADLVLLDPKVRAVLPEEFPTDTMSWLASTLFSLTFTQLFLVFAPVALFARFARKRTAIVLLTVLFNVFVTALKASEVSLPRDLTTQILVIRTIASTALVYIYLEGGIWVMWWIGLLMEARLLPGLFHF